MGASLYHINCYPNFKTNILWPINASCDLDLWGMDNKGCQWLTCWGFGEPLYHFLTGYSHLVTVKLNLEFLHFNMSLTSCSCYPYVDVDENLTN